MLEIKISSKRFDCEISINHKITVFVGNSGVGKTQFVKALTDKSGAYKVAMSDNCKAFKITKDSWYYVLDGIEKSGEKSILVVDDEDFVFSVDFARKFSQNKSSYLLIIGRTDIIQEKLGNWNCLPIAADAVKEFVGEGKNHKTIPALEYNVVSANKVTVDVCLCEDKKSGFVFFSKIFKEIYSADSKDKLLGYISNHEELFRDRSVYLCIDCAASGLLLRNIYYLLSTLKCNLTFCSKYESFEYLLLKSNFFNISDEEIYSDLVSYLSIERRCTSLLEDITRDKVYAYNKGTLSKCFYEDCCVEDRSKSQCHIGLSGDKISALLVGTEFEFLLKLRQVF